jgi:hypothetical protein
LPVVEHSDTTGTLSSPPLHLEGVPATFLMGRTNIEVGELKSNALKATSHQ